MRVDPATLTVKETYAGTEYLVWHKQSTDDGPAGKYLVDASGTPVFLVDPGINGVHRVHAGRPAPGHEVRRAEGDADVLHHQGHPQPPAAVGAGAARRDDRGVLEMSGVPSLAFAVGVYLPLSSSSPIFIGGMVRWLGDRYVRRKHRGRNLTEEQLTAEGDKSPGVLLASGYIAGGAIAGILIAFMAGRDGRLHRTHHATGRRRTIRSSRARAPTCCR